MHKEIEIEILWWVYAFCQKHNATLVRISDTCIAMIRRGLLETLNSHIQETETMSPLGLLLHLQNVKFKTLKNALVAL